MAPSPMGIFSRSFEAMFATQPTMRASIRIGRKQLDRCLCGSFATTRENTEEGQFLSIASTVKALASEWVSAFGGYSAEGLRCQFARPGDVTWKDARIVATSVTDGVMSMTLEAEFA